MGKILLCKSIEGTLRLAKQPGVTLAQDTAIAVLESHEELRRMLKDALMFFPSFPQDIRLKNFTLNVEDVTRGI